MLPEVKQRKFVIVQTLTTFTVAIVTAIILTQSAITIFGDKFRKDQQISHWYVASAFSSYLEPFLKAPLTPAVIQEKLDNLNQFNPESEVYVIDGSGQIIFSPKSLKKEVFEKFVAPIGKVKQILSLEKPIRDKYLFGPNPIDSLRSVPISVAQLSLEGREAYVYAILISQARRESRLRSEKKIHIIGIVVAFLIAGFGTFLGVFFKRSELKRQLTQLNEFVHRVTLGDFSARIDVSKANELGELGDRINLVAEQLFEALEASRRTDRLRRELISNISHDLNTPLTSALGYMRKLSQKKESAETSETSRYVNLALRDLELLRRLISDLFELSKLESEDKKLEMESFSILDIVTEEVIPMLEEKAAQQKIRLHAEYPSRVPHVYGDLNLIARVLRNLIENAVAYNREYGEVIVDIKVSERDIGISVWNTGDGIPGEQLPRVFDRFFRADNSRKKGSGTGLGLAIVKRIIEAHNKNIEVESEVGVGTRFSFELERADKRVSKKTSE